MLGESKVFDGKKHMAISTVLIYGIDYGFRGNNHHLFRHDRAFVVKHAGINTESVATLSEIVIAEHFVAQRIPVNRRKLVTVSYE
jgi:hypothetical protein